MTSEGVESDTSEGVGSDTSGGAGSDGGSGSGSGSGSDTITVCWASGAEEMSVTEHEDRG